MRRVSVLFLVVIGVTVLTGCGAPAASVPGASAAPSASAAAPSAATASSAAPTTSSAPSPTTSAAASAGSALGSDCAAMPAELTEYPDLLAMIPDELGGQATHSRQSFRVIEYLCVAGGQDVVDQAIAGSPDGFDLPAVEYATGAVNLGDVTSTVSAFRTPGADAEFMADNFGQVAGLMGGATSAIDADVSEASLGGKTVIAFSPPESRTTYLYPKGEVLFVVAPMDEATAETIFAALP